MRRRSIFKKRPEKRYIVSFADTTQGHTGVIYRALNFKFIGKTLPARFFIDKDGRLRHPRQNGVNITLKKAKELGWTPTMRKAKNKFVYEKRR